MEEVSSADTAVHRSYPNPSIVKLFIREIVQPTKCTCWGYGQQKRQFSPENCRELKAERSEKLRWYGPRPWDVRCIIYNYAPLGQVKSFLICWTKYFACNIHIFSPNISDKLVSITSFKASPLSLLDVSSSKERAAAIVRYLVSGAGDIMSYRGH